MRGRRCPSAGADKVSRAPSGHRLVARLSKRGRGAASPGRRAAGGGRRRGRQGRGGRGAAWDLRRRPGALRVLPPAPPLSPPRPASRSPPPRRVGPGRAERREIVSTANKKRRHMTRQEEGKRREGVERGEEGRDRAQGAEGAGERENVGRAARGLGRAARTRGGGPCLPPSAPRSVPHPGAPEAQPGPRPGRAGRIPLLRHRGAGVAGSGPRDQERPRPWAAGLVVLEARGRSPGKRQATRASRLWAAGNVSSERSYPIRMPYMARK